jgi:hypothetical protein
VIDLASNHNTRRAITVLVLFPTKTDSCKGEYIVQGPRIGLYILDILAEEGIKS